MKSQSNVVEEISILVKEAINKTSTTKKEKVIALVIVNYLLDNNLKLEPKE